MYFVIIIFLMLQTLSRLLLHSFVDTSRSARSKELVVASAAPNRRRACRWDCGYSLYSAGDSTIEHFYQLIYQPKNSVTFQTKRGNQMEDISYLVKSYLLFQNRTIFVPS